MTISPAILIIAPSWVGDMVMAQSLFKRLKQRQPEPIIDVLVPKAMGDLLQRMPEVRKIWTHTIAHGHLAWSTRYQLGKQLRVWQYQQAIVLQNSWKSALIPYWAHIPIRSGFIGEMRYGLLNDLRRKNKKLLAKTVEQFVALGLPEHSELSKIPIPSLIPQAAKTILSQHQLTTAQPILALCPGAEYGIAKRWPPAFFAQVAQQKISEGWQVWLFGSQKDNEIAEEIQKLTGNQCSNLCGKTQLAEAVDLLALATMIISNDSGLMHIAAALNKPLIAVYGSSDPHMTPPLSHKSHILYKNLPCSPCFQRTCPLGHLRCLHTITPEEVLALISL